MLYNFTRRLVNLGFLLQTACYTLLYMYIHTEFVPLTYST